MKKNVCIIIAIVLITSGVIAKNIYAEHKAIYNAYNNAISLVENASYEEALSELEKANPGKFTRDGFYIDAWSDTIEKPYKNSIPIYSYALAQIEYNSENASLNNVNRYLELISENYSGELSDEINTFKNNFKPQYDEYVAEKNRILEQELQEIEQKTKERLKNTIPYVGMRESYINDTVMGKYHDKESVVVGKNKINKYRWKNNSGITILYVECKDYAVTDVTQYYKDTCWTSDGRPIYSGKSTGNSASSSKKKKSYNDDSYNVSDYYDAEDFYDDYYDDFYDYEDAEDYFYENAD